MEESSGLYLELLIIVKHLPHIEQANRFKEIAYYSVCYEIVVVTGDFYECIKQR